MADEGQTVRRADRRTGVDGGQTGKRANGPMEEVDGRTGPKERRTGHG